MGDLDKQKCGGDLDKVKPATVVGIRQAGPASYNQTTGFTIDTGLSSIDGYSVMVEGDVERHAEVASVSGGVLTIMVREAVLQWVDESGTANYGIHKKVSNGVNLSGDTYVVIAVGDL